MKSNLAIITAMVGLSLFTACNGDHSASTHGNDTANHNSVHTNNMPSNPPDTSKVTTTTGGAINTDNSGSGGTKIAKDTAALKMKAKGNKK